MGKVVKLKMARVKGSPAVQPTLWDSEIFEEAVEDLKEEIQGKFQRKLGQAIKKILWEEMKSASDYKAEARFADFWGCHDDEGNIPATEHMILRVGLPLGKYNDSEMPEWDIDLFALVNEMCEWQRDDGGWNTAIKSYADKFRQMAARLDEVIT